MCLAWAASLAVLAPLAAQAADPGHSASGFYLGGHIGYGFGSAAATLGDPTGPGAASADGTASYGMMFGGLQAGYQVILPSRLLLGAEVDFSGANYMEPDQVLSYRATRTGSANEQLEYVATLRGRLGYAMDGWTPFLTSGFAWASTRVSRTDSATGNEDATPGNLRAGYAIGGGIDYPLDHRWSARAEYIYTDLGLRGFLFSAPARYDSQYDFHRFRVGLNYRFGENADNARENESASNRRGPLSWEAHGQTTFVFQGYPPFSASYDGPLSLPSGGQARETWSTSLFLGVRLWRGGEFYFNPELFQGVGVGGSVGAGGYPNGEAQKTNFAFPRFSASRFFLRQEFGLGGDREKVESDYGQLAGEKDISRFTLQIGRFSVHDVFDNNRYADDSRTDFLNWSIWMGGAFDYPADRIDGTYGLTMELNQRDWAARAGYFLVPQVPEGALLDTALFSRGGYVTELEIRFAPNKRPGAARFGAWLNSAFTGSYSEAVALAAPNPDLSADDTIAQTRRARIKYGFYFNFEQELSDDLGLFGRYSWNDGRTEIDAFTDIDSSMMLGLSIKGTSWGRTDDRIGLAGAINGISADHTSFLAAGGLGLTVGDGQLSNYAAEKVVETYYAFQIVDGVTLTADYQLLVDPAYNGNRGPVSLFAGRLTARF